LNIEYLNLLYNSWNAEILIASIPVAPLSLLAHFLAEHVFFRYSKPWALLCCLIFLLPRAIVVNKTLLSQNVLESVCDDSSRAKENKTINGSSMVNTECEEIQDIMGKLSVEERTKELLVEERSDYALMFPIGELKQEDEAMKVECEEIDIDLELKLKASTCLIKCLLVIQSSKLFTNFNYKLEDLIFDPGLVANTLGDKGGLRGNF
ncbi:hypothetical protein ACH5RR_030052, partial [Cinchona calisaya]